LEEWQKGVAFGGGEGVWDGVHGVEEFVDSGEECGVAGARVDDGGVVGRAGIVEGIFVLLLVKLYIWSGLGMPWDPPGGAGDCWVEGSLGGSA